MKARFSPLSRVQSSLLGSGEDILEQQLVIEPKKKCFFTIPYLEFFRDSPLL